MIDVNIQSSIQVNSKEFWKVDLYGISEHGDSVLFEVKHAKKNLKLELCILENLVSD